MNSEILKKIKQKIQEKVERKELYSFFIDSKEIESFNDCISSIKSTGISGKESNELQDIYKELFEIHHNISTDWNSNKASLSSEKIIIHCRNLESILKIVNIIKELKKGLGQAYVTLGYDEEKLISNTESLQKKMKEALEKMQQQNAARQKELEKKIEEEFSKCIESGTIDAVSITKYGDQNLLYATIKLKEDNKSTDIKVSEFLNSDFCKKNNIVGFFLSNGDQKESINGHIYKGVRYYYLGTTTQYKIKFNWYIDERECSITLSANSDGTIKIVSDKPDNKDLEENKDVKIKVGNTYLSLADAVKTCKQNSQQSDEASSKLSQSSSANEHFRPLVKAPASCF